MTSIVVTLAVYPGCRDRVDNGDVYMTVADGEGMYITAGEAARLRLSGTLSNVACATTAKDEAAYLEMTGGVYCPNRFRGLSALVLLLMALVRYFWLQ